MNLRYIEDLILHVCDPINNFNKTLLPTRDMNILYSINSQLKKSLALTENQAKLVTKIFNENIDLYKSIKNIDQLIKNQIYKMQFRKIEHSKKIYFIDNDIKNKKIAIEFKPYDVKINSLFKKHFSYNFYRDGKYRYILNYSENNIITVIDIFKQLNFDIDDSIIELYEKIKFIKENINSYIPIAYIRDEKIILSNCNNLLLDYFEKNSTGNFLEDCRLLVSLNIKLDQTIYDRLYKNYIPVSVNNFFNCIPSFSISDNIEIVNSTNSYPILIIMRDDDELELLKKYVSTFNLYGIENKNMSILYRSKLNVELNSYIKENCLNNLVDNDTKIVFIKHKIPKILYKLNFKPKMILNNLAYNAHFSIQKLLEQHRFVLFVA